MNITGVVFIYVIIHKINNHHKIYRMLYDGCILNTVKPLTIYLRKHHLAGFIPDSFLTCFPRCNPELSAELQSQGNF